MKEIWKPIPGWSGLYSVSNLGRVRSEERTVSGTFTSRWGTHTQRVMVRSAKVLKANIDTGGYAQVVLQHKDSGVRVTESVHRLVLSAFRRPPEEGEHAMHKNDIRSDNRLSNLKWGTKKENVEDMVQKKRYRTKYRSPVLGKAEIESILSRPTAKRSELASEFDVSLSTISKVRAKGKYQ